MLHFHSENVMLLGLFLVVVTESAYIHFKVSCRDLIPKEPTKEDFPDPFVKVWYGGVEQEVGERLDNIQYPQFQHLFSISFNANSDTNIVLELRDHDPYDEDDSMGSVSIHPLKMCEGVERVLWNGHYVGKIRFPVCYIT